MMTLTKIVFAVICAAILAQGGLPPKVNIRREVSTLDETQVLGFRSALVNLKKDVGKNGYQALASFHGLPKLCPTPEEARYVCCVHGMPTFPHWHRLYVLQMERALLANGSDAGFPYWDWTKVMTGLPELFTNQTYHDHLLDQVVENPFLRSYIDEASTYTVRDTQAELFNTSEDGEHSVWFDQVLQALEQGDYCKFQKQLEVVHNTIHNLVGGPPMHSMSSLDYASYDPIFFGHHSFIDKIWAVWQELQKRRNLPYDRADCCPELMDNPMMPFSSETLNLDPLTRAHAIPQSVWDYRNLSYAYDNLEVGGATLDELERLIEQKRNRPRDFANFLLRNIGTSAKISLSVCTSMDRCVPAGFFFLLGSSEEMPWAYERPYKYDITRAVESLSIAPKDVLKKKVFIRYTISFRNRVLPETILPPPSISFVPAKGAIASNLQPTNVAAGDGTPQNKLKTWMECQGDNLVLNEPVSEVTAHHVYVFRNGESVASTSVPATGQLEGRLLVKADSSVVMTNLSSSDFGIYRVEVKMSEDQSTERSTRLVVGEPPETDDGSLAVNTISSSGSSSVRLTCGNFTSLGFPPVSAVWEDPLGHLLPSDGFKDQTFYLDLSVDTAEPGDYCCRLDCRPPTHCCLEEQSPLRECVKVKVQTGKAKEDADHVSVTSFSQLQQQVLDMAAALRLLQESERQDCSQSGVTAMAQLIQRQARCDQLDAYVSRVEELEVRLATGLDDVTNASVDARRQQEEKVAQSLENFRLQVSQEMLSNVEDAYDRLETATNSSLEAVWSRLEELSTELADLRTTTQMLEVGFCPVRKGYLWYGGRCLKFDTRSVDFYTARANCLAEGAHLMKIQSPDIDGPPLRDAARAAGATVPTPSPGVFLSVWVGATDIVTKGTFVWGDGTLLPKSSPLWYPGQPDDLGGNEDCVNVHLDTKSLYLNDLYCTARLPYFCEYD